jgi:hypothetical protein
VPAGYRLQSRTRRGPMIAGTIMFSVTYGINILAASVMTDDRANWLYVPGVGTWPLVRDACDDRDTRGAGCEFLVMHSLVHSIGLGLIIFAIASPRQVAVRERTALVPSLSLRSARVGTGSGMLLEGSF